MQAIHQQQAQPTEKGNAPKAPFFRPGIIQPKLSVNTPGDAYEQEADAMADKVMRMQIPAAQSFFKPAAVPVQRKCKGCEEDQRMLHRKEGSNDVSPQVNGGLDNYVASLGSSGQPLPDVSRQFFEPRFEHNFSNVRIHTDSVAAKSAQSVNALAYTTGNNIVFNRGQYAPDSQSGQKLMAHELTHVEQQGGAQKSIQKATPEKTEHKAPLICNYTRNTNVDEKHYFNFCPESDTAVNDGKVSDLIKDALAKSNGDLEKAREIIQYEKERSDKCNCCDYNLTAADHYLLIKNNPLISFVSMGYMIGKELGIAPSVGWCPLTRNSPGVTEWEARGLAETKTVKRSPNKG